MSLFGVNRRRATIIVALSIGVVVGTWLLHQRYPTLITDSILGGVVLAFISTIVLGGIRDWVTEGEPEPPQFFTHASERLGRPRQLLGYQMGNTASARGQFFRTPPTWTDIEEEYVIEHPALHAIHSDITTHRGDLIVLEGPPASGKSCLLFSLAYHLLADTRFRTPPVYILELKASRRNLDQLPTELDRLPRNAILLVDDVHLDPLDVVEFANVATHKPVTLVYATRPVRNYPGDLDRRLEDLARTKHSLEASAVAGAIIDRFLTAIDIPPDERERVTEQCLTYQHDLYALDAALRTYRAEHEVSDDHIHAWIADRMLGTDDYDGITVNRGHFLIAIACLYRFEVPVTRNYLIAYLDLPEDGLDALVTAGDILAPTGNKYGLHHSSVAELIVQAARGPAKHNVPQQLRTATSTSPNWPTLAVESYITEEPHLAINTLAEIANTQADGRRMAKTLLGELDPTILATGIDPVHTTVDNLGSFFYLYLGHDIDPPQELLDALPDFAADCSETNPAAWGWTTNVLARLDVPAATRFGDRLGPLLADAAPELIADTLTSISYGNVQLSMDIAADIDPARVATRLDAQDLSPAVMAMIIAKLVWVDPGRFNQIATRYATLLLDIDPPVFPMVLCRVAWGNQQSAQRMLTALPRDDLAAYLDAITDPEQFYHVLAAVYLVAPSYARELQITPPRDSDEDVFVPASTQLLAADAPTPVAGLQQHVTGPAHRCESTGSDVAAQLVECAALRATARTERLWGIAATEPPEDCLLGLLSLSPETISEIGRAELRAWVSDTLETEAIPDVVVETAETVVLDSRNHRTPD